MTHTFSLTESTMDAAIQSVYQDLLTRCRDTEATVEEWASKQTAEIQSKAKSHGRTVEQDKGDFLYLMNPKAGRESDRNGC